jgi:hypothetical protein
MPDYDEHSNEVDLLPPSGAPSIADKLNSKSCSRRKEWQAAGSKLIANSGRR